MIVHDFEQYSPEWFAARIGIPTASNFDRILTPKTLKPAAAQKRYAVELALSRLWGHEPDNRQSQEMARGSNEEDPGRRWYAMDRNIDVQQVGFVTNDGGGIGGSPDGLVGDDGLIEIKTPMAIQHVTNLVWPDEFAKSHIGQVQGLLWLTHRKWCDLISWNPELPPLVLRIEPDLKWQKAFEGCMAGFATWLTIAASRLNVPNDWREQAAARLAERKALNADLDEFARLSAAYKPPEQPTATEVGAAMETFR